MLLDFLSSFGFCLLIVELIMVGCWLLYLYWKNISIVDIGWSVGLLTSGLLYFFLGEGFFWRKLLLLTLIIFSAGTLAYHLIRRFEPTKEDPRYEKVLAKWPFKRYESFQVLTHYLFQGFVLTILTLPFALIVNNRAIDFTVLEVYGSLIVLLGVWGETSANQDLYLFKKNPVNALKVCETGLWKYARHPNYFFQFMTWVGFSLFAFSAPLGWLGIISPLFILYLLLKISGIPLAEEQSLKRAGDAYRNYQERTSSFFPWFPGTERTKE